MAERTRENHNTITTLAGALGLGAAVAYFLDPARGRRRRAGVIDQATRALHLTGAAFDATSRDVRNRLIGTAAALRSRLSHDDPSDDVLVARVRARIGGLVRHARAVDVSAHEGQVTLRGPVLAEEVPSLIAGVRRVRGVRAVDDQLAVHHDAAGIPALQGDPPQRGPRSMFMRATWPPAARLVAGGAGAILAVYGVRASGVFGPVAGVAGLGLVIRALTNLELKRLVGGGAGHRAAHGLEDRHRDTVGRTGIWPVSGPLPAGEAPIVDQGELGTPLVERRTHETVIAASLIIDPVCGDSVDIRLAERCEYNGQAYYFHSVECRQQFDAAPERFTTALDRRRSA